MSSTRRRLAPCRCSFMIVVPFPWRQMNRCTVPCCSTTWVELVRTLLYLDQHDSTYADRTVNITPSYKMIIHQRAGSCHHLPLAPYCWMPRARLGLQGGALYKRSAPGASGTERAERRVPGRLLLAWWLAGVSAWSLISGDWA